MILQTRILSFLFFFVKYIFTFLINKINNVIMRKKRQKIFKKRLFILVYCYNSFANKNQRGDNKEKTVVISSNFE